MNLTPFQPLDGNTCFTCSYAWLHEDATTNAKSARIAEGVWPWDEVRTVQTMDAETFPEMVGPRCCVMAADGWLYLFADYEVVQAAYREWRKIYKNKASLFATAN